MPYIEQSRRDAIDNGTMQPSEIGDLTYAIYKLCLQYVHRKGVSFTNYCAVIGSLNCTALELYRKRVGLYEDEKESINGRVD